VEPLGRFGPGASHEEQDEQDEQDEEAVVSQVRVHNLSLSLDGFGTGDGISVDAPFGHAGERLHEWMFATRYGRAMLGEPGGTDGVDQAFTARHDVGIGAEVMGRGKFGPQTGPWTDVGTEDEWRGWWGREPPFHTPVFVLTHHARPSIEMAGGTVFHFVDGSPQEVLDRAREAAGGLDVRLGGGPSTVREFLAADLVDLLHVVQVPVLLGRGVRLWDGLESIEERYQVEAVSSPSGVTHLTFSRR
jgi:dihydrofolate reductase